MVEYSIWLTDKTHFGQVGDLSLSTGQTKMSVSLWFKSTLAFSSGTQASVLCGNQDTAVGHGGWNITMQGGLGAPPHGADGELEWDYMNTLTAPSAFDQPSSVHGLYGKITEVTNLADGNWHNIIFTYDGTGVNRTLTSVPNSTHMTVDDTTGMLGGDEISQAYAHTQIVSVDNGTDLTVVDSTGFSTADTYGNHYVFTRGVLTYLDGVIYNIPYIDFQYPTFNDFDSAIPFGIGNVQQLFIFTRIGKYAYPALYHGTVLTPSQVTTIAAGSNLGGATAQWLFTEGSGLTAADNSGNGHTLTFNTIDSWSTDVPFTPSPPPPADKSDMFLVF